MLDIQLVPILVLGTLLAHTLADFHIQGILAKMKQKAWWEAQIEEMSDDDTTEECLKAEYGNDYLVALLIHSLEWSIIVAIPAMFVLGGCPWWLLVIVILNTAIHAQIDNAKCNNLSINLVQDQACHMLQLAMLVAFTITGC